MVKLFFGGIAVFTLIIVGAFATIFGPLMAGVDRNLGGSPKMPFHSPVPQPVVAAIGHALGQLTPSLWLTVVVAAAALLLLYTIGATIGHSVGRWKKRRAVLAELRLRGRLGVAAGTTPATALPTQTTPELESMWK